MALDLKLKIITPIHVGVVPTIMVLELYAYLDTLS